MSVFHFFLFFYFSDYYEEMLTLLDLFTVETVSPVMWQIFGLIYEAFQRDGFDYFSGLFSIIVCILTSLSPI